MTKTIQNTLLELLNSKWVRSDKPNHYFKVEIIRYDESFYDNWIIQLIGVNTIDNFDYQGPKVILSDFFRIYNKLE